MGIDIYNIVLETTRKCNMKCAHCLRGEPQNKCMDDQHMRDFLLQVDYISTVTFTGGEPTLPSGMKIIERFMEICNELGVDVGNFFIVTNAKTWRNKFPELIHRLYDFCSDNDVSGIDISGDKFHETNGIERNDFRYRLEEILEWEYGISGLISERPDIEYRYVIAEGRGVHINNKELELDEIICEYWDGVFHIKEGTIYLNCDGKVLNGCDWSYKSQNERKDIFICNASDDLEECVLNYEHTVNESEEMIEDLMYG